MRFSIKIASALGVALVLLALPGLPPAAIAQPLSDQQVVERIIRDSRSAYHATGHPCACPYDHARNGSNCGGRSAYSRPGGAAPRCYPKDISMADIVRYRATHR